MTADLPFHGATVLVQASCLLAFGLLAAAMLRGRGPALQSTILRAALVAMSLTPLTLLVPAVPLFHALRLWRTPAFLVVPPQAVVTPPANLPPSTMPVTAVAALTPDIAQSTSRAATVSHPPTLSTVLTIVWLLGTAVAVCRLVIGLVHLRSLRKRAAPASDDILRTSARLASALRVPPPAVLQSAAVTTPCLIGLFQPAILLPNATDATSDVLLHELAHLRRHDCRWFFLGRLVSAALWFNPLSMLLARQLEATADQLCDDLVLSHGTDRAHYAGLLLSLAERCRRPLHLSAGAVSRSSRLGRRVHRILDTARPLALATPGRARFAVVGSVLIALFLCALPSLAGGGSRASTPETTNALLGSIYGKSVFANDVFRPIDSELHSLATNCRDLNEFRTQARAAIQRQIQSQIPSQIPSQIEETLLISAAKATLTDDEKRGLDLYMATQRSKLLSEHGGSQALADEALRAQGTTVEKKLDDDRTKMIVRIYMHRELYSKIVVTRQMVVDEYERTKPFEDEEIELFTITLRVSRWLRQSGEDGKLGPVIANPTDAQVAQAELMALKQGQEIVDQLRKGADFGRLVEDNNSQDDRANYGGRRTGVKRGSLQPVLENAAFALPANTVGEPLLIKAPDFHREIVVILKVGQKKEARTIPFSEAQKDIYTALERKQYQELAGDYAQKLYRQGAVEPIDRMTNVAVDVAVARYATE